MTADGQWLKRAAVELKAEIAERVKTVQHGLPNFFDNYVSVLADYLVSKEAGHQWLSAPGDSPDTPETEDQGYLRWFERLVTRRNMGRFVSVADRKALSSGGEISDIFDLDMVMSQGAGSCLTWKGQPLFKSAYDFALVPMLLWETKPATILEVGSGTGASAIWMADLLRSFGRTAHVYSVDIKPVTSTYDGVTYLRGDCTVPEALFPQDLLKTAPHPWLIVEDAPVNVAGVLAHLDRYVEPGDYLYIEDSRFKEEALAGFMTGRAGRYRVDTRYTDFFGRNATAAPDTILAAVRT